MAVYAYSNLSRTTTYVSDGELNWRGTWAPGTLYAPPWESVSHGGAYYVSIVASTNSAPSAIVRQRMWAQLVLFKETVVPTVEEKAYALAVAGTNAAAEAQAVADEALALAQTGTETADTALMIAAAGTNLALAAYYAGTNAQSSADTATILANGAFTTSLAADQTAYQALQTAWNGTSGVQQVYPIAETGTNLAGLAITWIGTLAASGVDSLARSLAQSAYDLAAIGTNVGTTAYVLAEAGSNRAEQAYALAASGGSGTALSLAQSAYDLAQSGTAGVDQTHPIAVAGTALANLAITWIGTLTEAGVDNTARGLAQSAYSLAAIGTNVGTNAFNLATTGSNLAWLAYSSQNSSPNFSAGGTMTGNLVVPNTIVGVGTTGYAGTLYANFTGPAYQQMSVNGALTVSGTNYRKGAEIAVILQADDVVHPLYMGGEIASTKWFGTTPPSQIYTKDVLLALTCINDAPVSLIGAPTSEA
jgi:hypothetical protein